MDEPAADESEAASKSSGWTRIKSRLRPSRQADAAREGTLAGNSQDDLTDFFRPNNLKIQPAAARLAPKLDTSALRQWRAVDADSEPAEKEAFRPRKPPRRPGLQVQFSHRAPEVIGEGGDESEIPPIAISKPPSNEQTARVQLDVHHQTPVIPSSRHELDTGPNAASQSEQDVRPKGRVSPVAGPTAFRKRPLVRMPTGLSGDGDHSGPGRISNRSPVDLSGQDDASSDSASSVPSTLWPSVRVDPANQISPAQTTHVTNSNLYPETSENLPQTLGTSAPSTLGGGRLLSTTDSSTTRDVLTRGTVRSNTSNAIPTLNTEQNRSGSDHSNALTHNPKDLDAPSSRTPPISTRPSQEHVTLHSRHLSAETHQISSSPSPELQGIALYANSDLNYFPGNPKSYLTDQKGRAQTLTVEEHSRPSSSHSSLSLSRNILGSAGQSPAVSPDLPVSYTQSRAEEERSRNNQSLPTTDTPLINIPRQYSAQDIDPISKREHSRETEEEATTTEFTYWVSTIAKIFSLGSELDDTLNPRPIDHWLRAAIWWLIKARDGIEKHIKSFVGNYDGIAPGSPNAQRALVQHHVNLAKVFWILEDVVDKRITLLEARIGGAKTSNVSEIVYIKGCILKHIKVLSVRMKRASIMPAHGPLESGLDSSIWIDYPTVSPELAWMLSESMSFQDKALHSRLLLTLPLEDSERLFLIRNCFVRVSILMEENGVESEIDNPFTCLLSMVKTQEEAGLSIIIASLTSFLNVAVRPNTTKGPTWEHVRWEHETASLRIKLPRKVRIRLYCLKQEYQALFQEIMNTQKHASQVKEQADEKFLHKAAVQNIHWSGPQLDRSSSLISPCEHGIIYIFEKRSLAVKGVRPVEHLQYRLVIVTTPRSKLQQSISCEVGSKEPVQYTYETSADSQNRPGFSLIVSNLSDKIDRACLRLAFLDIKQRDVFRNVISGQSQNDSTERVVAQLPTVGLDVLHEMDNEIIALQEPIQLRWVSLQVINSSTEKNGKLLTQSINSESLRIVYIGRNGCMTDRMNLGPGELHMRLPFSSEITFDILRRARHDLDISIGPEPADPRHVRLLTRLHTQLTTTDTIQRHVFQTLSDLHKFQHAITNFAVRFDSVASYFAISRRMMVVPIYKKLNTEQARIQIVQHANSGTVQLLAFFQDYNLAENLSFQLKSTDVYEKVDDGKGGIWSIRFVDAKFALPASEEDDEGKRRSKFVSLDTLQYASEHDDILIGFSTEQERERFASVLPAPAVVGRKFTLRRRI